MGKGSDIIKRYTTDVGQRAHELDDGTWFVLIVASTQADDRALVSETHLDKDEALSASHPNAVVPATPGRRTFVMWSPRSESKISVTVDVVEALDGSDDDDSGFKPLERSLPAAFNPLFKPTDQAVIPPHRGEAHL